MAKDSPKRKTKRLMDFADCFPAPIAPWPEKDLDEYPGHLEKVRVVQAKDMVDGAMLLESEDRYEAIPDRVEKHILRPGDIIIGKQSIRRGQCMIVLETEEKTIPQPGSFFIVRLKEEVYWAPSLFRHPDLVVVYGVLLWSELILNQKIWPLRRHHDEPPARKERVLKKDDIDQLKIEELDESWRYRGYRALSFGLMVRELHKKLNTMNSLVETPWLYTGKDLNIHSELASAISDLGSSFESQMQRFNKMEEDIVARSGQDFSSNLTFESYLETIKNEITPQNERRGRQRPEP